MGSSFRRGFITGLLGPLAFLIALVTWIYRSTGKLPFPIKSEQEGELLVALVPPEEVQAHWQQLHGGRCTLHILNAPLQLSLAHKQQLQRLLQEVLTNAQRHGRATHVQLWLQYKQQVWRLLVRDNGCGGELGIYGAGLHSIRARAQALGAQLFIKARSTRGWTLYLRAPLVSETNENTLG